MSPEVGKTQRLVPDSYLENLKVSKRPAGTSDDRVKRKAYNRKKLKVGQRRCFP